MTAPEMVQSPQSLIQPAEATVAPTRERKIDESFIVVVVSHNGNRMFSPKEKKRVEIDKPPIEGAEELSHVLL